MKGYRKLGIAQCANCNISFEKPISEIKRNLNLGRRDFCSRTCLGIVNTKNFNYVFYEAPEEYRKFNYIFKRAKKRAKVTKKEFSITFEHLAKIWERHKGICVYSGVRLVLPKYGKNKDHIYTASLDRIVNDVGYVKGNVQFISIAMNHMKSIMTHEYTLKLIELIKQNN